jgi:hypothetical protein
LCGCGCGWTTRALCISHTRTAIFWTFQSIHTQLYETQHCPHTEHTRADEFVHLVHLLPMNRNKRITDRCSSLLQTLKFGCDVHHFVATRTLTARSTGLPCRLLTWHPTIPPHPHPYRSFHFRRQYKSAEIFISGHMLILTFFLVLVCGTRA